MVQKIFIFILIAVIVYLIYEVMKVYRVFSKATFKTKLSDIIDMIGGSKLQTTMTNHTSSKLAMRNVSITFIKNDSVVGGFKPTDITIVKGDNPISLEFLEGTKFVTMAADYVLNKMGSYKVRFRGSYLGFIPFTYTIKMKRFLG